MATTRTEVFNAVRLLVLSSVILVGGAAAARASTLTVFFSGNIDLTDMGGAPSTPYSGFFTWDPAKTPFQSDPNSALYFVESYQLILNGADRTLAGPGNAGVGVGNNSDLNDGPGDNDGFFFLAALDDNVTINGVNGDTLFVLLFLGDKNVWNTVALPTDYSFLSLMPTRLSAVSLEVSGEGEDVPVGNGGSFAATPAATPVPEPATLTLTALGLAGVIARRRRARQARDR